MSHIVTASLDAGNGRVKIANGNGETILIPHAIQELTPTEFERVLARSNADSLEDYIIIGERYWVTGESVYRHNPNPVLLRGAQRYVPEYYGVLAMSMLARMYPYSDSTRRVKLMASYAPGDFYYRKNLKNSIPQDFEVTQYVKGKPKTWRFVLTSVRLLEEGLGAFFQSILTEDGKDFLWDQTQRVIVFDGGHKTTEGLVIEDLEADNTQYQSIEMGIGDIERDLKSNLEASLATQLRGARLNARDIRQAIDTHTINMYGAKQDVSEYVNDATNRFLAQVMRIYNQDYEGGRTCDGIILAGGGARLLWQYRDLFAHQNVTLAHPDVDLCIYSNVYGMNKFRRFLDAQTSIE